MFKNNKDFNRYIDPTGEFTNSELKISDWYVRHKLQLRHSLVIFLVLWSVVTLGYGLGYFFYYLVFGYSQDQKLYNNQTVEFSNFTELQNFYKPQGLQIKSVNVFESAKERYDLVGQVLNPNERWIAYVTYKFIFNGGESEVKQTTVLPGDKRPIIFFGQKFTSYPNDVKIILENVSWRYLNKHNFSDIMEYLQEKRAFRFDNFKFISAGSIDNLASIVQFTLYNDSAYGYLNPEFYLELLNDNGPQGYLYLPLDKFKRGEKMEIDLRSMINNLEVNNLIIYPIVDVFDKTQFMKVDGSI